MLAVNDWRKLKKLSRSEFALLVQALLLLPITAFCIKLFGFRRLYAAIAKYGQTPYKLVPSKRDIYTIVGIVTLASKRSFYRPNCLQKSLVLWWLLRRQSIESELRIGVRKQDERLEAHAWIECQGYVLNDTNDVARRFLPFAAPILPMGVEAP